MFGYEEELQDEITKLKVENEKLKLYLSTYMRRLIYKEDHQMYYFVPVVFETDSKITGLGI